MTYNILERVLRKGGGGNEPEKKKKEGLRKTERERHTSAIKSTPKTTYQQLTNLSGKQASSAVREGEGFRVSSFRERAVSDSSRGQRGHNVTHGIS